MKKIALFLLSLLCCTSLFAGQVNRIVFFGDSLSDNGNLYGRLIKILPKSPPYYQGRFSNGPTWAELLAQQYGFKYKIYALGGATAILHKPSTKFIAPTTLQLEFDEYIIDALFRNKSDTLYIIWIGANDYLFEDDYNIDALSTRVVARITRTLTALMQLKGKHFVVMNLPNLSRTPFARANNNGARLYALTQLHNTKLAFAITELQRLNPTVDLKFVNIYDTMNDFIDNPMKYNRKYHLHITDTQRACWEGGLFLKQLNGQTPTLLSADVETVEKTELTTGYDVDAINHFIKSSPFISYTYKMGELYSKGYIPCGNPDEHLFWDDMHPTATVHQVISKVVMEQLGSYNG